MTRTGTCMSIGDSVFNPWADNSRETVAGFKDAQGAWWVSQGFETVDCDLRRSGGRPLEVATGAIEQECGLS